MKEKKEHAGKKNNEKKRLTRFVFLALLSALVLTAVFAGFSRAQESEAMTAYFEAHQSEGGSFLTREWRSVSYIAIFMVMFASALAFMVGRGLNVLSVETWAKNEFYQAIASVVLLTVLVWALEFTELNANELAKSLTDFPNVMEIGGKPVRCEGATAQVLEEGGWTAAPSGVFCSSALKWRYNPATARWAEATVRGAECEKPCYFFVARAWLGSTFEKMVAFLKGIVNLYANISFINYSGMGVGVALPSNFEFQIGFNPFSVNGLLLNALEIVASIITKAMLAVKFQELLLLYVQNGIYPLFVAVGFILRCFWFTRKLGGLLLAMGIGMYFALPLMYTLAWYTVEFPVMKYEMSADSSLIPDPSLNPDALNSRAKGGFANLFSPEEFLFSEWDENGKIVNPGALDLAARLILVGFGLPLLSIFVWIGFVKGLSPVFGGDVEIAGLTRIL
ncbi:hypothetical protein HY992_00260 [Candidatus Micrarchaeota archaeon]|nr:hypothetical protein [Candidatus Micrarchaeota archaeon]